MVLASRPPKPRSRPATVLLVSELPLVRMGLKALLSDHPRYEVCGECESAEGALIGVEAHQPDLLILDLSLRASLGLPLVEQLKEARADMQILVTSTHEDSLFAGMALRAGATGVVNKNVSPDEVLVGLNQLAAGKIFVSPHIAQAMLGRVANPDTGEAEDLFGILSERERATFEMIGRGWTTRRIARELRLSVHTVETYRERLRQKLKLKNSTELVFRAIVWVLLND